MKTFGGRPHESRTTLAAGLLALAVVAPAATPLNLTISYNGSSPPRLTWNAAACETYEVQSRDQLVAGGWLSRATVVAAGPTAQWEDLAPLSASRFYRLALASVQPGLFEPPEPPPADPCGCSDSGPRSPALPYVYPFSGEVHFEVTDLRIPGRGLDFIWARRYRSRNAPVTALGTGWDFSYNIRIQRTGPDLLLFDGHARQDLLKLQPDGSYAADQFFREGQLAPSQVFTLTFADSGTWEFLALDGSPLSGRISRIADRNGNALTFAYDPLGRLVGVMDSLGRPITIAYAPDGRLASVTDFTGRQVTYAYYIHGDTGGPAGALKSVTSPAVVGTPNGNDFPAGKTTTYTYTTGLPHDLLNHNLLTVTDPQGQTWFEATYAATLDLCDLDFDRVTSYRWGGPTDRMALHYVSQAPTPANGFAVIKALINDRVGNVSEWFYDTSNRCVVHRLYTGRMTPGTPPADPPVLGPKLRPADPGFFETRYEWNADSRLTRVVHPNGNVSERVHEFDLDPAAPRRARGNVRIVRRLPGPLGGDQAMLVEQFDYAAGLGGCCGLNFVTRHVDARGHETLHAYDARGNRTNTVHRVASAREDWEYNAFGQVIAHLLPDNGSGHRRRDTSTYHLAGPQMGYLQQRVVDDGGFSLTTTYEYDAVGNVVRVADPSGNDTLYTVNALNQVVRESSRLVNTPNGPVRYTRDTWYDANDNVVREDISNQDETGAVEPANPAFTRIYEYGILHERTRLVEERGAANLANDVLSYAAIPGPMQPEFVVTEHQYDANRNRTLIRYGEATAGRQSANNFQTLYDERDLPFRETRGAGSGGQSTTQLDYDANGNLLRRSQGTESAPRITTYTYDGYNRRTGFTDPMGNVTTNRYDPNGNLGGNQSEVPPVAHAYATRVLGQTNDVVGSVNNVRLSEVQYAYDALDRRIRNDARLFDTVTQAPLGDGQSTSLTIYSDNSQVLATVDDGGNTNRFTYDTANRRQSSTDAKSNLVTYAYDANGNLSATVAIDRSDLGLPDAGLTTTYSYDGLDRRIVRVDAFSISNQTAYDSRNNRVLAIDGRGNRTRYVYDGLDRLVETRRELTDTGDGSGVVIGTVVTRQSWDDSSRLISQTDDNANVTRYAYDPLNRRVLTLFADNTAHNATYDVHHNRLTFFDGNSSGVTSTYDLLDRLTTNRVQRGAGVLGATNEVYQYDGLSRLVRAQNDDSVVTRAYDSLGGVIRETQQVLPGGVAQAVTAAYDGEGNLTRLVYPGGRTVVRTVDALGQLVEVRDDPPGPTAGIATHSYVGRRLERRDYGNGTRLNLLYDELRRVADMMHSRVADGTILDQHTCSWDDAHNQTKADDSLASPPGSRFYGYDSLNRLVQSQTPLHGTVQYHLDGVGNRQQVLGGPDAGPYFQSNTQPEPADFQMNQYTFAGSGSRQYDRNGNLIQGNLRTYSYDFRNRLVQTAESGGGPTNTYRYDCLGRRLERNVGGNITRLHYYGAELIEEKSAGNTTLATHVFSSAGHVLQSTIFGTRFFLHEDERGSIRKLTDAGGHVVEQYSYSDYGSPSFADAFGTPLPLSEAGNTCLFGSYRFDPETGFVNTGLRLYNPRDGRYLMRSVQGIWTADNSGCGTIVFGNGPIATYGPEAGGTGEPQGEYIGNSTEAPPKAPPAQEKTKKKKCEVVEGPKYTPNGTINATEYTDPGGNKRKTATFKMSAKFKNDPPNCIFCECCEVRQEIQWDTAAPPNHDGFKPAADYKKDTWYEDRDSSDKRYGHRSGKHSDPGTDFDEYVDDKGKRDQAGGCEYKGSDSPARPATATGTWKFRITVVDVCNGGATVGKSDEVSVRW